MPARTVEAIRKRLAAASKPEYDRSIDFMIDYDEQDLHTEARADINYLLELLDSQLKNAIDMAAETVHWRNQALGVENERISQSKVLAVLAQQSAGELFISDEELARTPADAAIEIIYSPQRHGHTLVVQ